MLMILWHYVQCLRIINLSPLSSTPIENYSATLDHLSARLQSQFKSSSEMIISGGGSKRNGTEETEKFDCIFKWLTGQYTSPRLTIKWIGWMTLLNWWFDSIRTWRWRTIGLKACVYWHEMTDEEKTTYKTTKRRVYYSIWSTFSTLPPSSSQIVAQPK